jgi:hypothetical protein
MESNLDQFGSLVPLLALIVVALATYFLGNGLTRPRHPSPRYFRRSDLPPPVKGIYAGGRDISDSAQQLTAVMQARFEKRRILQRAEYRAFRVVEQHFAAQANGHRVFAQTSLGEILSCEESAAWRSINSKRVDILVVDRGGWPVLAVEYQGNSHYLGTAAARDAVKKEALRQAGVAYAETYPSDTDEQIRSRIDEVLARARESARRAPFQVSNARQDGLLPSSTTDATNN